MTAVAHLPAFLADSDHSAPLTIPTELNALFDESPKCKASFARLPIRDRRGFVRYINEAQSSARARRATIIAKTLIGLARDIKDDPR